MSGFCFRWIVSLIRTYTLRLTRSATSIVEVNYSTPKTMPTITKSLCKCIPVFLETSLKLFVVNLCFLLTNKCILSRLFYLLLEALFFFCGQLNNVFLFLAVVLVRVLVSLFGSLS